MTTPTSKKLIPDDAHRAAKRGFIRTSCQSLAAGFAGIGGTALVFSGDALLALGLGIAGAIGTAVINGAQSYFDILAKGVPVEYSAESPDPTGPLTD